MKKILQENHETKMAGKVRAGSLDELMQGYITAR